MDDRVCGKLLRRWTRRYSSQRDEFYHAKQIPPSGGEGPGAAVRFRERNQMHRADYGVRVAGYKRLDHESKSVRRCVSACQKDKVVLRNRLMKGSPFSSRCLELLMSVGVLLFASGAKGAEPAALLPNGSFEAGETLPA